MVRPREMSGAHRMERVWNWVLAVERAARSAGRVEVSFTIVGLPVWATQPATPSPILTRNVETSLPFSPSASSKASSCFSSSTISIDQASEGMSCWILAMISSITLRGSRIELAVFTMSVRMASRWAVCFSWRPSRRRAAAPRGARRPRGGPAPRGRRVARAPGAEVEVEPQARGPAQRARRRGAAETPPTGLAGSARRAPRAALPGARRRARPARRRSPRGRAARPGLRRREELVGERRGRASRLRLSEGPPNTATRAMPRASVRRPRRAALLCTPP